VHNVTNYGYKHKAIDVCGSGNPGLAPHRQFPLYFVSSCVCNHKTDLCGVSCERYGSFWTRISGARDKDWALTWLNWEHYRERTMAVPWHSGCYRGMRCWLADDGLMSELRHDLLNKMREVTGGGAINTCSHFFSNLSW